MGPTSITGRDFRAGRNIFSPLPKCWVPSGPGAAAFPFCHSTALTFHHDLGTEWHCAEGESSVSSSQTILLRRISPNGTPMNIVKPYASALQLSPVAARLHSVPPSLFRATRP
jgi:hypothetical protein